MISLNGELGIGNWESVLGEIEKRIYDFQNKFWTPRTA
jgi:hypothetical protein